MNDKIEPEPVSKANSKEDRKWARERENNGAIIGNLQLAVKQELLDLIIYKSLFVANFLKRQRFFYEWNKLVVVWSLVKQKSNQTKETMNDKMKQWPSAKVQDSRCMYRSGQNDSMW